MTVNLFRNTLSIAMIASSTLACKLLSPAPSPPSLSSVPAPGNDTALVKDDFSNTDSGWETENTSDDSIQYANGGLRLKAWSSELFMWSDLGSQSYKDIHIEATVKDDSVDNTHSFGLMCDQQGKEAAHYFFALDPTGYYEIGKRLVGKDDVILTNNGQWGASDLVKKNAASYRLGADCGHGTLTFYVDGKKIDTVADATYTDGIVALFLWSVKESTGPVTFDDFRMTPLK
jgi:hypothetical protein